MSQATDIIVCHSPASTQRCLEVPNPYLQGKGKTKGKGLGAKVPTSKQSSAGKRPRINRVRADAAYQQESLALAAGWGRRATRSSSRA